MKLPNTFRNIKGFTLIELLVVIGILAILLSIVLIAINPARQFGQANNTRRASEVTQILNAVGAYSADHKGLLPPTLEAATAGTTYAISKADVGATPHIDMCDALVPNYIPALPQDPQVLTGTAITDCTSNYNTGYTATVTMSGTSKRVTIAAPTAQNGETISNTR
jgi:prepilin-type N-terminal cleavage/methylation domain-containing protein